MKTFSAPTATSILLTSESLSFVEGLKDTGLRSTLNKVQPFGGNDINRIVFVYMKDAPRFQTDDRQKFTLIGIATDHITKRALMDAAMGDKYYREGRVVRTVEFFEDRFSDMHDWVREEIVTEAVAA